MRVLTTGGCGFIGSAVVRHGIDREHAQILNIDKLTYAATPEAVSVVAGSDRYKFLQADICDERVVYQALDEFAPDAVIHLAAESHVDRSIDGPGAFIKTNVIGTYALLEAVKRYLSDQPGKKRQAFRFVHVSTDEVYGSLDLDTPGFTEASPYAPRSPYAASKAGSDHLVRAWGETYGLPIIITNCSNNYGTWQFPEKLIPLTIINAHDENPLPVYGAGLNVRDWLHVEDHARALWHVLRNGHVGETYNIGGNAEQTNIDVVRNICRLMDARFPGRAPHDRLIEFVPDRPGHDLRYSVDTSKIHRELGWHPEQDFETGLAATVDWYLANDHWWRAIRKTTYDGRRLGACPDTSRNPAQKRAGASCA